MLNRSVDRVREVRSAVGRLWERVGAPTGGLGGENPASLLAYLSAAAGTFLISGVQLALDTVQAPLFSFFFWCLLVTRIFGLRPALLAMCCSTALGNWFFLEPVGLFSLDGGTGYSTGLFALTTITSVLMYASIGHYAATQRTLLAQERQAALKNRELTGALEQAVRARDNFLAVAGHELKTPLTALLLQVQGFTRRYGRRLGGDQPLSPVDVRTHLDRQVDAIKGFSALIDGLLDVSHLDSGQVVLHLESVSLNQVVEEVMLRYAAMANQADCSLALQAPEPVVGFWDRLRLEQIVGNLLSNAIKYGRGKPVQVQISCRRGVARVAVRDLGVGIAAADHQRIFGRFQRLSHDRRVGGLGLGLWITRQLVELLRGGIWVDSLPGEGSTFTVQLPLRTAARAAEGAHSPPSL